MITTLGSPFGSVVGTVIPPLFVNKEEYVTEEDRELGVDETFNYIITQCSITSALFLFTVIFFRNKPKIAPR